MNSASSRTLILILLSTAMFTGCNLPFGQTPAPIPPTQEINLLATLTQQAIENDVQETLTAPTVTSSPTITLTPLPPETVSPTNTPLFFTPVEIKFRSGGTIAYQKGGIKAGQQVSFTLEAGQGQTLIAVLSSAENQAYFEIKELEGGEVLVPFSDSASSIQTKLPWTGDYQITLSSPVDLEYFLSVEVPANLVVSPGLGASVVNGTINVLNAFHPDAFTRVRYLVGLQAGSLLNVQLSSSNLSGLSLALIGADDGQPFLRHEVQSHTIDNFSVPVSQGYYLDVYSVSGESGAFSLTVEVE